MATPNKYQSQPAQWTPGFLSRLPWLGFSALLGFILCILAAVLLLTESNSKPVDEWTWQPSVYLNILSTIANFLLPFAFAEAVTIAWWLRAAKENTNIGDLHRLWNRGTNLLSALAGLRQLDLVAIASLVVVLTAVNGPLLQRASTTELGTFISEAPTTLDLSRNFSDYWYTGYLGTRGTFPTLYTANFTPVVQNWTSDEDIYLSTSGCSGTCGPTRVRGLGFALNCSSNTVPYNLVPISGHPDFDPDQPAVNGFDVFGIYIYWGPNFDFNAIQVSVQYKNSKACAGDLQIRNCTLRAAIVSYPVIIDGNRSTIALDPSTSIFDDTVEDVIPRPEVTFEAGELSTYGGLGLALSNAYNSLAHMSWGGAIEYETVTSGAAALRYIRIPAGTAYAANNCTMFFADPTADVLAAARDLMFRTSVAAANGSDAQTVSMPQSRTVQVFASHYLFLGLAVGASAAGLLTTAALFYGYHRLGRHVSLSPVETAKAFGVRLLGNSDSNADVDVLLKEVGERQVRYGAVVEVNGVAVPVYSAGPYRRSVPEQLLFAGPDCVRAPQPGDTFAG